jgi:hypothetical protein
MRVIRHPEVPQELEAAALWYEERQPGLGEDFLVEYQATLGRILREPKRWRIIRADNRKLNFHRFPYAIVYSVGAMSFTLRPLCTCTVVLFIGCIACQFRGQRHWPPAHRVRLRSSQPGARQTAPARGGLGELPV